MPSEIKSPEEYFGHKMGADRKLVRWEKIVEYFWHLDKSPCVKVTELGKSTEGNPFLLAVISSPENLKNLNRIAEACVMKDRALVCVVGEGMKTTPGTAGRVFSCHSSGRVMTLKLPLWWPDILMAISFMKRLITSV